tara:strand:+ start:3312 stop:4181 length:870 start_codon:yes stop_codon:yes gene_type:complete
MINSKNPYWENFKSFFFKSYKISSVGSSSLKDTTIGFFKGSQLISYFVYFFCVFGLIFFLLIAYGPLQYFLPKSTYFEKSELIELILTVDSLESELALKSEYFFVIKKILSGELIDSFMVIQNDSSILFQNIDLQTSKEDSLLRELVQAEDLYNIPLSYASTNPGLEDFVFFKPVDGIVTSDFDVSEGHFGVDVVTNTNSPVKAALDGVVIFSDWSISSGHTVIIQHAENIISVYMHSSSITKKNNDLVKAGEVIGVVGNSGESSSGPHLHFELWQNGSPVNPIDYIDF